MANEPCFEVGMPDDSTIWESTVAKFASLFPRREASRAAAMLAHVGSARVPRELLRSLVDQLARHLPGTSDPEMALVNLERFFEAARSPLALAALFDRDETAIPILLKVFSTSQYLAELLIRDPAAYDLLRLTAGQPVSREVLVDEITSLLENTSPDDTAQAMRLVRRFKHREILRVAFGDIIAHQDLQTVTGQISILAEAGCEAALAFVRRQLITKYGRPESPDGRPLAATIIALGKLGGNELNYSSDIDLMIFFSGPGRTTGPHRIDARDWFDRLARGVAALLNEPTAEGVAWRVDYRLRPNGSAGPLTSDVTQAIAYYDLRSRTWERQALVKARPVAGDLELGRDLLEKLQPRIYANRISMADIDGIRALKRQIERKALIEGGDETNVKTGRGGIRDIEFVIQFLQLLHGRAVPEVRAGNTLEAIGRLYHAGCLNFQEQMLLDQGYRWLRRLEHRLQIMFDLQTHSLPADAGELRKVAIRTGLPDGGEGEILERFRRHLMRTTSHNRAILDHLLHGAFASDDGGTGSEEADLVLDPAPSADWVVRVMSRHGYSKPETAWRHLMELATERSRFLSTQRCRHFLAAIADGLIAAVAATPDPDTTLMRLSAVSESLGGKAVLWELFSSNPTTMKLYVRLCAACDYLCDLLIRNPGMVDGLMDSLTLQGLPTREFLDRSLQELLAGAEDIEPGLHGFRDVQHLRVGARDVAGRDELVATHQALSDIAEVCLGQIVARERDALRERHGVPLLDDGRESELMILALGKFGGEEPNYHSDLDLVFLYDGDGNRLTEGRDATSFQDWFSRFAANIARRVSNSGPCGKLYEVDCRLRPTGKSGSLAVSVTEFIRYFTGGSAQLWEHLALCKGRAMCADAFSARVMRTLVASLITSRPWRPADAAEIAAMRERMEHGASRYNLKRGPGGTVDIEFSMQMLQLRFAATHPVVLVPNTLRAAQALCANGLLSASDRDFFSQSWEMLRTVESRLRLMGTRSRHDLPEDREERARLAWLLGFDRAEELVREVDLLLAENRRRFRNLVKAVESA